MKPVFRQIQLICCVYESLRYLDLEIWRFFYPQTDRQTDRQPIALSLVVHMHTWGNNNNMYQIKIWEVPLIHMAHGDANHNYCMVRPSYYCIIRPFYMFAIVLGVVDSRILP